MSELAPHAPLFSVVIPTFSRPDKLRACLTGISRLDFDAAQFEVIVVDDGSPAPLDDVLAPFRASLSLRLVTQSRGGPATARNAGAAVATGRYLAFIDDDCAPARDWLAVFAAELARDGGRLLGGRVENALADNPYADASEAIGQFVYDSGRTGALHERFFTTNNIAVPLDLFRSLGGFDVTIPSATAEDKEFCDRWRARGLPLAAVPAAVVYHSHDLTFARFVRQHFNYGRGILSFRLLRRKRAPSHLVPEPVSFYVRLVLSPARARGVRHRWRRLLLLIVSQLATAAGAAYQGVKLPGRSKAAPSRRRTPTEA